jgi:hypothetical protein
VRLDKGFFFVQRKQAMKCNEFEQIGLDTERDASLSEIERAAAREHAGTCPRCAALQDSWDATVAALHEFAVDTALAQTPARVEMRLRQEFRTTHVTLKVRRTAVIAAWMLAAAAVLVGAVGWKNWSKNTLAPNAANHSAGNAGGAPLTPGQSAAEPQADRGDSEALMADSEWSDFTLLPGTLSADTADAAILRVRLQRSSLGSLGLPVNEERAAEWIQVDLLVGNDGLPQAVRLPQE